VRYPSAPLLLTQWTAARFPAFRVAVETPANLQAVIADRGAMIRVQRYGGGDDVLTVDRCPMDVDVFAADFSTADAVCGRVRDAFRFELPGVLIDAGADGRAVVAKVSTTSGPSARPVTDSSLARCGASFSVWLHAVS
jgi:hypothetical protein